MIPVLTQIVNLVPISANKYSGTLKCDHLDNLTTRHGLKPGCQEAEAEAFSILEAEAEALTLFKLEAEALVMKPKPSYL